jgi:acyl-CoA dehydrogenase
MPGQAGRPHHRASGRAPHAADPEAYTEAGRALTALLALQLDIEDKHPDAAQRQDAADLVALLTPVAKAFMTDNGFEAANMGMQVFGGHGFIREWGMEQLVRDCRISQIYEGTNGIQAIDLLGQGVAGSGPETAQVHQADSPVLPGQ